MAEEFEEATPEEKLNIANYFIVNSPPAQVDDVLKDVITLVGDESLLNNDVINKMMGTYHKKVYNHFTTVDNEKMMACPAGATGGSNDEFVQPSTGTVYVLDHRTLKATKTDKEQSLSPDIEGFRKEIESAMVKYLESQYKDGKAIVGVYGADNGDITICISAINKRLSSFWSGNWRGTYKVNVKGSGQLSCQCKIHVHYFEEGNVQLHAAKEKTMNVKIASAKDTAANVSSAIGKWESEYQANLEEMYVDMHQNTFKSMRRVLPVSKMPMKWTLHAQPSHSLASELMRNK